MAKEYVDDGVPFLRSQNVLPFSISSSGIKFITPEFHAKLKKSALEPGDLVVVRTGYPGTAAVIPGWLKSANCADLVVIKPSPKIDPHFLASYFNSSFGKAHVGGSLVGVAQQHFNVTVAKEMYVPCPDIDTQRKIAAILSAYGDLIENNLRRIKILEEMAQNLYREWFVKFRFPGHEQVRMVDSPLGKIPEGWEVKVLSEACNLVMGQSPKSEFYNDVGEGLPFHQGVTDFGDRYPKTRLYCTVENRLAETGDVLFSVRAPVGRINIAPERMVIGRGLSAIQHSEGYQWFAFHLLKEIFKEEDTMGGGTIFKAVTKADVQGIEFLSADAVVHRKFEATISPIESQIENLTKKNVVLRQTRDLLLPKLISGELDVSELDVSTGQKAA